MTGTQQSLFDRHGLVRKPRARRRDPGTSLEAAERAHDLARRHGAVVLSALRRNAPASAEDVERHLAGSLSSLQIMKRISDLLRSGAIEVADENGVTRANRRCRRYRVAGGGVR